MDYFLKVIIFNVLNICCWLFKYYYKECLSNVFSSLLVVLESFSIKDVDINDNFLYL